MRSIKKPLIKKKTIPVNAIRYQQRKELKAKIKKLEK
jgi:hypothetical protein